MRLPRISLLGGPILQTHVKEESELSSQYEKAAFLNSVLGKKKLKTGFVLYST